MNYIKLKEEIGKLKISEKAFLEEYCDIGVQGFNKAIKNNTLSIRSLELISKGLNFPMSYWWQDDLSEVHDPEASYNCNHAAHIETLKEMVAELKDDKKMLKDQCKRLTAENDELRSLYGLKKEGTSGS